MNSTPQVETVEISDADLDNVSGGLSVNAVNTLTGAVDGIAPVSALVDTAVGTVEGVTGRNTAPVTNLVAGLWSPLCFADSRSRPGSGTLWCVRSPSVTSHSSPR